jgi:hypothetical protein
MFHAHRQIERGFIGFSRAWNCNLSIALPETLPWEQQIQGTSPEQPSFACRFLGIHQEKENPSKIPELRTETRTRAIPDKKLK